jgi:Fungal specific transcription factor domain
VFLLGCKKGNRECVYPEPKNATKTNSSSQKAREPLNHGSPGSSTEEYEDEGDVERFGTIPDDGENRDISERRGSLPKGSLRRTGTGQSLHHQKSFSRRGSETPSLVQDKGASPSPSTEGSIVFPVYSGAAGSRARVQLPYTPSGLDGLRSDWSHLPHDVQFYLSFFYKNLTPNHYFWKHDSGDFLRTHYLDAALRNDALLYAITGFSAFQRTLSNPAGKIQDFLQYYNKAVSLLLKSLSRGERHNTGILLAILQLATIEVSLVVEIVLIRY